MAMELIKVRQLLTILLFFHLHPFSVAAATAVLPKEALPTKSGYLPINKTTGSAIFFTFYEAIQPSSPNTSQTPLLIWLQGGPGCSSMIGNFFELGPWKFSADNPDLQPNPHSWNRRFGLLFLDNPIGTGFSIAANQSEIPTNQKSVARHLYIAFQYFLSTNPGFQSRPLYITGESYAGKYVPAFGYYVLNKNRKVKPSRQINLQGVAIGNGLTDPEVQVTTHAASAYFSGLINAEQKFELEKLQISTVERIKLQKWREATDARNQVLHFLQSASGLPTLYDLRRTRPYETKMIVDFLGNETVKQALGAKMDIVFEECSDLVSFVLHEDVMKSVKFMVETLVAKVRVLLYQGLFDLRDGVVSTEAWIEKMNWEGLKWFLMAKRKVWKVEGEFSGSVQRWGKLSHVVVAGAGHLVPADQGLHSQSMIEEWVLEEGYFGDDEGAAGIRKAI
ncbi:Serine carboxypeptidase-like 50 [Nymphaea thermarum]|nr:Serine carboxypeptidase-like 50 [Nymphaea thermarum]